MPKKNENVSHQDWDDVVITKSSKQKKKEAKKKTGGTATVVKHTAGKNKQTSSNASARKIEEYVDGDAPKKKKVLNPSLKREVVTARLAKGWNQKKLAQMANIPLTSVKEIEAGKKMPNQGHLNKIGRALGQQFKKTK